MRKYLSYSEIATFYANKKEWYQRYIDGTETPATQPQTLGKIIHAALADPRYEYVPVLREHNLGRYQLPVSRIIKKLAPHSLPEREKVLVATFEPGVQIKGIFDALDTKRRIIADFKTYENHGRWSQWSVDQNLQLSFYALLWKLTYHSYFTDMIIHAIDVKKGNVKHYHTVRGPWDLQHVQLWISQAVYQMKREGLFDKRLTLQERLQGTLV